MKNFLKDTFLFARFTREEQRGILLLITGIFIAFLAGLLPFKERDILLTEEERQQQGMVDTELEEFLSSIKEKKGDKSGYRQPVLRIFDPNVADSITFLELGLPGWMARNILRYRSRGGKFRKPEDFRKIYGMTDELYQTLLPYISIAIEPKIVKTTGATVIAGKTETGLETVVRKTAGKEGKGWEYDESTSRNPVSLYQRDTVRKKYVAIKYPPGTVVDLNRADTTELKKIPGIGSWIAARIVGYRQRLGGFYRIEQLQEIRLDYQPLRAWFRIDTTAIRTIDVNHADVEELRNHPYISNRQADVIVKYRKKKGRLRNLTPFMLYEEFTETDLRRIIHYVCFE